MVVFIEKSIYGKYRQDCANPWQTLAPSSSATEGAVRDSLRIEPHHAKANTGRGGGKLWPDYRKPADLEQRHIALALTGSTNTNLFGVFRRDTRRLEVSFDRTLCRLSAAKPAHLLVLHPRSLSLIDGSGNRDDDLENILRWLP
ncbi:hypothetical protein [Sorangium cellulosum]|uniref:hypothetical protein n=1 Tax=Sorangium cellulosum TaxID=56 RepID=UPI0013314538|nr:hypothetical protein [Sorangium cellulosum]